MALDADPELARRVLVEGYKAKPERIFRINLESFDWNCAQHINPRFTEQEIDRALRPIRAKLEALESENAELTARLRRREAKT